MIVLIKNVLKFLRYHTYRELLNRLCRIVVKPLYESAGHYIVNLDLWSAAEPGPEREVIHTGFGGFRRDVFDRFGFFDERLVRNQDLELFCRMHKAGAKVIISPEIRIKYYNRSTFAGLCNQAFINGLWTPYTIWIIGGWTRFKHFVPLGFLLSILALGLAGFLWPPVWFIPAFELLVYVLAALVAAFISTRQTNTSVFLVFLAFVQLHLAYGIESLWGVISAPFKFGLRRKRQPGKAFECHRE